LQTHRLRNTQAVTSDRFQRPQTAAGAHGVSATDLPPHPPDVRDEEVAELLAADFPVALRGYERNAVDAYVQRASRVIAELQAGRSPQSAVRYALEQVSEETRAILQQAHDTADAITSKSRAQAAERLETAERESAQMLADAQREAAELRAAADRRVRDVEDDVAAIWQDRERLVEDARDVAARLAEVADDASRREPPAAVEATEGGTDSLPAAPAWGDVPDDGQGDGGPLAWAEDDEADEDDDGRPLAWADDEDDPDGPPAPAFRTIAAAPPPPPPPPPSETAPEPSLADAPPPPSEEPGPLAFELQDDAELGPMDEPAAPRAVEEAAVPGGQTVEWTPPFANGQDPDADDDDTAERLR
jgi:cell division septum initiation protein DivIVA